MIEKELKPRSPEDRLKVKEINKMRSKRFMERLPMGSSDKNGGGLRGIERVRTEMNLIPINSSQKVSSAKMDKLSRQGVTPVGG